MNHILLFLLLSIPSTACSSSIKKSSEKIKNDQVENREDKKYGLSDIVSSAIQDRNGNLWFATTDVDEGVYKYDGKNFVEFTEEDGLSNNVVWSMMEDSKGNIWFGTAIGLSIYDGKEFKHLDIPTRDIENIWGDQCRPTMVISLLEDKEGNIWIGTCGGGAHKYDGKTFESHLVEKGRKQRDSLHRNLIKNIIEDDEGNIWMGSMTRGGLTKFDGENYSHYSAEDEFYDDMIFCATRDKKDNLWFGCIQTVDGGLYSYDGKSFKNYTKTEGLPDNFIFALYADEKNNIWISSGGKNIVSIFDGEKIRVVEGLEGKGIQEIRWFLEDDKGKMWFGGREGNLWSYDGKNLKDFTQIKWQSPK